MLETFVTIKAMYKFLQYTLTWLLLLSFVFGNFLHPAPWAYASPNHLPIPEKSTQETSPEAPPTSTQLPPLTRQLLQTSPKVRHFGGNLSFRARGGEKVRFKYQLGQWKAEVLAQISSFSRRAVLPVVCSRGENVASRLQVLNRHSSWQSQHRIHVLGRSVFPMLGAVVYVGELGLKGGGSDFLSNEEARGKTAGEYEYTISRTVQHLQQTSLEVFDSQPPGTSQATSQADKATATADTPIRTSSSAKESALYISRPATRVSDLGLARRDQLSRSKGPTPFELDQIAAKKLKEQIDKLYPKIWQTTDEAGAKQLVEELVKHLELEGFWPEDSLGKAYAQDYLVKLLERSHSGSLKQLVSATASSQKVQLIKTLEKLAALSSDQGAITQDLSHYTDAAILYQHMLSICAKEKDTLNSQEASALKKSAYQGLAQLQASMLAQATGADAGAITQEDVASLQKRISEDKEELEAFRAAVKLRVESLVNDLETVLGNPGSSAEVIKLTEEAYIQGSQRLFSQITQWVSELLSRLYQESQPTLGLAPCKYTVMGLGSLALQQITPYSDLEFAILMEDTQDEATAEAWREYFRKLTHLVHFRVINLGETVLPYSQYGQYKNEMSLDHLGKRGITFDLGGKTPLGRKDKPHLTTPYELIQPVSGLMQYLQNVGNKMEHMDKLLPYILESTCYVYGDSNLYEGYVAEKNEFLLKSQDISGLLECQARSLKKLRGGVVEKDYRSAEQTNQSGSRQGGDLEDFEPKFDVKDAGRLYDVKQEIYRLPDRLLYRLAMYYGILPTSAWDAVDQLSQLGIIGVGEEAQQAAHHLNYAVSFATMLRLQTYLHHGQQLEKATMLSDVSQEEEVSKTTRSVFSLPASSLQAGGSLFKYYYTALPLHRKMKELAKIAASPGQAGKLVTWFRSKGAFFQAEPFYDNSAETRAGIHQRLLQYKEVKDCCEEALVIDEQNYGPNHPVIAQSLNNLGNAWRDLGDACQALSYYKQSLGIYVQLYDQGHPAIAQTLNNLGDAYRALGNDTKALEYYKQALQRYQTLYEEGHLSIARFLSEVGTILSQLGQRQQALEYKKQVLEMRQRLLQGQDDSELAHSLNSVGALFWHLGKHEEALNRTQEGLEMRKRLFKDQDHPSIARSLNSVGISWEGLGNLPEALKHKRAGLEIRQRLANNQDHPDIAHSLNNVGETLIKLGSPEEGLQYCRQALDMRKRLFEGQDHPYIAQSLNSLGLGYTALESYKEAAAHYQQASEMTLCVFKQAHPQLTKYLQHLIETLPKLEATLVQQIKARLVPLFSKVLGEESALTKELLAVGEVAYPREQTHAELF